VLPPFDHGEVDLPDNLKHQTINHDAINHDAINHDAINHELAS
jgi:hypothetical protein